MASTIRISILADAANAVRGLRNTGSAADQTGARLAVLQRRVDKLDGRNVDIELKTKGFAQGVAQIVVANLALDRIRQGLPDLSFGLTGVANKYALVAAGALAATSATLPLVAATLAVGAALGAATIGVGLFAAVAAPTFKAVTAAVGEYNTASHAYDRAKSIGDTKAMTKAQQAMASSLGALTPLQRAATLQTLAMNKAWSDLSESQAPVVLGIISTAAGTLGRIIPRLTPAITDMGKAVQSVSSKGFAGLTRSVGPLVSLIKTQGVPAFLSVSTTIGNLLVVAGHLVTAFAPLGNVILAKLIPLTAAMRLINFDALARSATALLPVIGSLLSNLGGAFGNLIKAAAPLAGPVLHALAAIAGALKVAFAGPEISAFVAHIAKIVPAVAPIVSVLITAFLKFADVISGQLVPLVPTLLPIVKQLADVFVNVLTGLSPLLPALVGIVSVLATFLPILYPLILAFREAMIPVVQAVSAALVQLRPVFALIVGAVIALLKPVSALIVAFVKVAPILVADLAPALIVVAQTGGKLLTALAPLFPVFAKLIPPIAALVIALVRIAPVLVAALVPAIIVVARSVAQLLTSFAPLFPVLTKVVAAVSTGVTPVLAALGDALPSIVSAAGTLVDPLGRILVALLPLIPPVGQLAAALLTSLVPAALALVPTLVDVADAIGKAVPGAVAILVPILDKLTALVANPAFGTFALAVLGIVVAVKAWRLAQLALANAVDVAKAAQVAYTAVMDVAKLIPFRLEYAKMLVTTKAQAVATKAGVIAQGAYNVVIKGAGMAKLAADAAKALIITKAQAVATRASAIAQGLYNAAINSTILANVRAGVSFIAAKVAMIASSVASGVATAAQWLLNVALDANPIGLIVLAIAALAGGLIYAYKHSETFRKIVDGAFRAVASAFKFLWEGAKEVFGWLKDHWKLVLGIITGPVGLIVLFVTSHWRQIHDTTVAVFDKIRGYFVNVFKWVRDRFRDFITGVAIIWGGLTALVDRAIAFRDRVIAVVSGLIQKFRDIAGSIIQGFIDGVRAGFDKVRGVFTDLTGKIASWKGPPARDAKLLHANGKLILGSLIDGIQSQVPTLRTQLAGVSSLIQGGVSAQANVDLSATGRVPVTALAGSAAPLPGIVINVSVAPGADPAEAGRQVVSAIEAYERRTGRRRLLPTTS